MVVTTDCRNRITHWQVTGGEILLFRSCSWYICERWWHCSCSWLEWLSFISFLLEEGGRDPESTIHDGDRVWCWLQCTAGARPHHCLDMVTSHQDTAGHVSLVWQSTWSNLTFFHFRYVEEKKNSFLIKICILDWCFKQFCQNSFRINDQTRWTSATDNSLEGVVGDVGVVGVVGDVGDVGVVGDSVSDERRDQAEPGMSHSHNGLHHHHGTPVTTHHLLQFRTGNNSQIFIHTQSSYWQQIITNISLSTPQQSLLCTNIIFSYFSLLRKNISVWRLSTPSPQKTNAK